MGKFLYRVNHVLGVNLSKPIGRRLQGFLIAVLAVGIVQVTLHAQTTQTDCVGQYERAIQSYYSQMMTLIQNASDNYGWYNPMRSVMYNAIGIEYYAKAESAMFQMIACSGAPLFKS
jgi:hypothetical protein